MLWSDDEGTADGRRDGRRPDRQRPRAGELLFSPDAIEVLRADGVDIEEFVLALGLLIPIRTNENLDLAGSRIKHAFIHEPESSAWADVVYRKANARPGWSVGAWALNQTKVLKPEARPPRRGFVLRACPLPPERRLDEAPPFRRWMPARGLTGGWGPAGS